MTARDPADAVAGMREQLFSGDPDAAAALQVREVVEAEMTDFETRHVQPNAGKATGRGVWYPDLADEPWLPRG